MSLLEDYIKRLTNPEEPVPTAAETLAILEKHPYFGLLALAWLRRTGNEGMLFDMEARHKVAVIAILANPELGADYRFLINDLTGGYETDEELFPVKKPLQPDTLETIDIFLTQYSQGGNSQREAEIIEQLIFNPVPDYASVLEAEEKAEEKQSDADNGISEKSPKPETGNDAKTVKKATPKQEDIMLGESLAKMHILKKNYKAAFDILNKLNLNYPEKSIYFAVQLRFLEKLILNKELLAKEKTSTSNT